MQKKMTYQLFASFVQFQNTYPALVAYDLSQQFQNGIHIHLVFFLLLTYSSFQIKKLISFVYQQICYKYIFLPQIYSNVVKIWSVDNFQYFFYCVKFIKVLIFLAICHNTVYFFSTATWIKKLVCLAPLGFTKTLFFLLFFIWLHAISLSFYCKLYLKLYLKIKRLLSLVI